MPNHNSLEMGRKYNSQAELYPPVSDKERMEFGGIKMEPVTIDRQNSSMSKALTTGLNAFYNSIGETKPKTWKLVDQIVRIARSSGMNVDKVHPGDTFEINSKMLYVTMTNGQKLALPLSKEGVPANATENDTEVLVKREQIKDTTRQEWETILEADMTKILYDSMLARGIKFTTRNRHNIWSELSKTGNTYVEAMKAHGDKRLIAALDADKDFLAKKYTGTAIQHLAMIEYLRTYGLDTFIDEIDGTTEHKPTPELEPTPAPAPEQKETVAEITDAQVKAFVEAASNPLFNNSILVNRTALEENGAKYITGSISVKEGNKMSTYPLKIDVTNPVENKLIINLYGYTNPEDELGKVNATESLIEALGAYSKAVETHENLTQTLPALLEKEGYRGAPIDTSKEASEGVYEYAFTSKNGEKILINIVSEPVAGDMLSVTATIGDQLLGDGAFKGTKETTQQQIIQAIRDSKAERILEKQFDAQTAQFEKDFSSAAKKNEILEINKNPSLYKFALADKKEVVAEVKINGLDHTMNTTVFLGTKGAAYREVKTFAEATAFVREKAPEYVGQPVSKDERSETEIAAEKLVTDALTDTKILPAEFSGTPVKTQIAERAALEMISTDAQKHMRISVKPDPDGKYFGMYQFDTSKEPVIGRNEDPRKLITLLLNKAKNAE